MTNTVTASVGQTGRDRAIVMGGSIAGLAAARVLSDHFREVILVERDQFGAVGEHRRGVPQGRHTHGLLAGGLRALEGFFPGLFEEARRAGGLGVDLTREAYWCFEGGEYLRFASDLRTLAAKCRRMRRQAVADLTIELSAPSYKYRGHQCNGPPPSLIGSAAASASRRRAPFRQGTRPRPFHRTA